MKIRLSSASYTKGIYLERKMMIRSARSLRRPIDVDNSQQYCVTQESLPSPYGGLIESNILKAPKQNCPFVPVPQRTGSRAHAAGKEGGLKKIRIKSSLVLTLWPDRILFN